jgi:hypothetical protein
MILGQWARTMQSMQTKNGQDSSGYGFQHPLVTLARHEALVLVKKESFCLQLLYYVLKRKVIIIRITRSKKPWAVGVSGVFDIDLLHKSLIFSLLNKILAVMILLQFVAISDLILISIGRPGEWLPLLGLLTTEWKLQWRD